ncbi:MAG: RNA polymerase sigma factor [Candidatus Portnoybacteria bacterium]|nr:RNA polymerase sigma factor [Candidatus Portnoybacteria bacterium]
MEKIEEKKIIENCLAGNLEEFGKLYDLYAERIYRFIYFKTHHRETAQDLASQTFFKALENIRNFDPAKGLFSSWLYRIAANSVIDHWRKQKKNLNIDDIWDLRGKGSIAQDAENKDHLERVRQYLEKFSPEQRQVVIMRVWDELSYREIAEILGKSEASCKMMFSRALSRLRKEEILAILILLFSFKII